MGNLCKVYGELIEYDFLSSWIKYLRMQNGLTQGALAYGICSSSHLCYFENGKKLLRGDIIEALLKKLGVENLNKVKNIGAIRLKLYSLVHEIELGNKVGAKKIYEELEKIQGFLQESLYSLEFKVYKLTYLLFIENCSYTDLHAYINILDKTIIHTEDNIKTYTFSQQVNVYLNIKIMKKESIDY